MRLIIHITFNKGSYTISHLALPIHENKSCLRHLLYLYLYYSAYSIFHSSLILRHFFGSWGRIIKYIELLLLLLKTQNERTISVSPYLHHVASGTSEVILQEMFIRECEKKDIYVNLSLILLTIFVIRCIKYTLKFTWKLK